MFRCWMALALVAALWVDRAEAAELTGFGPIKFGMTKEEAVAALEKAGLEGEWERDHWLVYQYPVHDRTALVYFPPGTTFEVTQVFLDGRAVDVYLNKEWEALDRVICLSQGMYFVTAVKNKYDKTPIKVETTQYKRIPGKNLIDTSKIMAFDDGFWFDFEKEALIKISVGTSYTFWNYSLDIWYHAPVKEVIPF